ALGLPGAKIVDRDGHLLAPPWSARRTTRESTATLWEHFDVSTGSYGNHRDQEEAIWMSGTMQHEPWAQLLTLGDARFGILAGGPFDGRCYPLPEDHVPRELDVPGLAEPEQPSTIRYVLRDGLSRYEIARQHEGYYVVVRFQAEPSVQAELDHTLKLADEVIRHKVLLLPDKALEKAKPTTSPASAEA